MEYWYQPPDFTSFTGFFGYMNTITFNWFWLIVMLAMMIMMFIFLLRYGFDDAILVSLFITSVLSVLLRVGNLLPDWFVGTLIICTSLMGMYRYFRP